MVTAHLGQDAVLPCEVEGDTSAMVIWRKDGFPITQDNNKWVQTSVLHFISSSMIPFHRFMFYSVFVLGTLCYQRAPCGYMEFS